MLKVNTRVSLSFPDGPLTMPKARPLLLVTGKSKLFTGEGLVGILNRVFHTR